MESTDKLKARMLADPDTCGSVLLAIALARYKETVFAVDPMSLIMDLEDDFHTHISENGENRLKAMLLATETQVFQQDPEAFHGICATLWYGDPQLDFQDPLTLAEILWGIFEVRVCHGNELELTPGIQRIIDQATEDETGDPDSQGDPYSHASEAVMTHYEAWQEQMLNLGVAPKDLPLLEG